PPKPATTTSAKPIETSKPGRCSGYETKCVNPGESREFKVCSNGYEYIQRCAPGTVCRGGINQMSCGY
ncbi:hypothetical protein K7432_014759, partial [Basidiobolus ranarum]